MVGSAYALPYCDGQFPGLRLASADHHHCECADAGRGGGTADYAGGPVQGKPIRQYPRINRPFVGSVTTGGRQGLTVRRTNDPISQAGGGDGENSIHPEIRHVRDAADGGDNGCGAYRFCRDHPSLCDRGDSLIAGGPRDGSACEDSSSGISGGYRLCVWGCYNRPGSDGRRNVRSSQSCGSCGGEW